MTGLDAILHHNGFSMAAVGITIVFTALLTLSLIISQLHKMLIMWDNREIYFKKARQLIGSKQEAAQVPGEAEPPSVVKYFDDINESSRQFNLLIQSLGEPFSLPELIQMAVTFGIGHPYSTVSHLIVSDLIIPDHKGFFLWNHDAYNSIATRS